VVKRTWLYVRPGETFDQCTGCHEDRLAGGPLPTNPNPLAAGQPATNLNLDPSQFTVINFENDIQPIVENKCISCHVPTIDSLGDTIPPPGNLDLSMDPDTTLIDMMGVFPIAYVSLSGESMSMQNQVVVPAFPRRSLLIDYVLGLGARAALGSHPDPPYALTEHEKRIMNLWVLLGAQYK
jgi:hypothetical protein